MPSNYSSIGFPVENEDDLNALCEQLVELELDSFATEDGIYYRWSQDEEFGPELWLHVVGEDLVDVVPYFRGKSEMLAGGMEHVEVLEPTPLHACIYGWANPGEEDENAVEPGELPRPTGDYPFIFDVPGYRIYDDQDMPEPVQVRLCAMAFEFAAFESEKAYEAAQQEHDDEEEDIASLAVMSFIPSGTFAPDMGEDGGDDEEFTPSPEAVFSGRVLETKKITNKLGKKDFYWALVQTYGGTIDVVVDPAYVETPPVKGGIIAGAFYLCGDFS